jgi:ribulose-5-phosphate 4-epimerase/fuculose-1-phosphate aldolase
MGLAERVATQGQKGLIISQVNEQNRAVRTAAYRYARKLRPAEAVLRLEIHDRRGLRGDLPTQARAAASRYGFAVDGVTAEPRLRHLMLVWDGPMNRHVLRSVRDRLDHDFDTASVAFAYPDEEASWAAVASIDEIKHATDDRLNVIRPDRETNRGLFVSNYKLIQTMIAETVRVRYQPAQVADMLPAGVSDLVLPFFRAASERIANSEMWSRSPYDGCVAVRVPQGLVVTATQTSKAPLELDRLVLVHGYDEDSGTIHFSGPALPSADCVELMVLARRRPELRAFLHTHASRLITRNRQYFGGLRVGVRVSGEPALGHELARLLPTNGDTLVVLAGHGELFAGSSPDESFFRWVDEVCADARQTMSLGSAPSARY